ncbi:glycosyltransferase [Litoreibacter janthinus]|uniref:Glycosyltransferase involved in cell wall bisynthesis n=1 Tax=Litoreibacter janthinus TaxID=670154 RepID=A0A1I6ID53_9RHOB|nr:glycosyltransferase [Litoreibacter janthinus]SFR64638.1 Glycosyltransferase involved in cell wall bisynthesis [Litoreibacter janthinus]
MGILSRIQRFGYSAADSRFKKFSLLFHTVSCDLSLRMVFQKEMTDWQPDIVHSHDGISLPLAAKVAEACNAKLVFDSHELETHRNPPLPWLRKMQVVHLEKKYLPKADVIFTVGHKIAGYLEKTYKIARPIVLFNSPRKKSWPILERQMTLDRSDIRDELMIRDGAFLIVHTGNVTFNRGLEQAVIGLSKAADNADFMEKYPRGIHFAMIGNRVPAVVNRIEALHRKYGENIGLHFVPPIAPNGIVDYIKTAHACISPGIPLVLSYEFGMPNKLFEAILAGRPIVAADLVEKKKLIADNQLGVSYEADNTDELAAAFLEVALNYDTYIRSPERHEALVEKFCWEAQEKKLLEAYKSL